ncbi:family 20 glycosylhydrolase [Vibrio sp. Isolate24]|uniref:beta-N-acetylhexosaminidase n=1 Tax=Vibrio sp. Isolate24 TaxID=2908534 RepID=UPI001EFE8581|nr:family 20 glycosylhydrolase [Vibrio sp. Isolate24]MCG9678198.1 family 20 glycosylhydrolase [Vibrio sp. Isolate24]
MSYRIDLTVLSEHKHYCRFGLTLHNLSEQALVNWQLQFVIDRYILPDSFSNGQIKQTGSFCVVEPDNHTLAANQHYYCEFSINTAPLRFYTDGLKDALVLNQHGAIKLPVSITPIVLASPYQERTQLSPTTAAEHALIPMPNHISYQEGVFYLSAASQITLQTAQAEKAATWLEDELQTLYGYQAKAIGQSEILFRNNPTLDEGQYQLFVSATGIRLESASAAGFVHASATLMQLIKQENHQLSVPYVKVVDTPRFRYRGMMLDCARHFHPLEDIKRLINQLAHYKFNTFHWHLTDDEGWRLEINAFPQLTQVGAHRGQTATLEPQFSHLSSMYGGYYTQQQVREVIVYAQERGITVIPEIDIPGHCRAAIKALPELLCDPSDKSEFRSIQHYTDNVLSPAIPGTYEFLDKVLEEVAQLFPAPWVHIGADEVPDGVWLQSANCQALMETQEYQNSKELQGHLLRYAEQKLRSLGKRMVGWEEAQHGDKVSKDTVIYSWLSEDAALKCAKQGFDVILQPAQSTYLDMAQDYAPEEPGVDWANVIPLESAYRYEPLADIPDEDPIRKRILGIQCALWCELIHNQPRLDYMVFPRLTALAEACWTMKEHRDWHDYQARLKGHLSLLDKQHINYRNPWK